MVGWRLTFIYDHVFCVAEGGSGEGDPKGKEDKEKKIKEMEKTVDSHFRNQSEDDDHKT